MLRVKSYIALLFITPILISAWSSHAGNGMVHYDYSASFLAQDTSRLDSADSVANLPYEPSKQPTFQPTDRFGDPFSNRTSKSPLVLQDPASLKLDVEIDTAMNYTIYEKIGDINFRPTSAMSFEEFNRYHTSQLIRDYWKDKSLGLDGESAVSGRRLIPKLYISPVFDRIFGGDYVDIQPNGFVNLDFGGRYQRNENPSVSIRRQRNGSFNFDQQISMNVVGKIGEKLAVTANFDNNNTFDFQNDMKVEYTGFDEDIIKKIEIGNVSMPVSNSLMTGAQSLFGVKTQLQFGKLFVTGVASRQQGTLNTKRFNPCEINSYAQTGGGNTGIAGGGTDDNVNKKRAWEYAEFQHFFLGHFFRDNYEKWLSRYPLINNGSLQVDAGRVEVWQLTIGNNDTRSLREVVALTDLGESKMINRKDIPQIGEGVDSEVANNAANNLFNSMISDPRLRNVNEVVSILRGWGLEEDIDFVRAQARKLDVGEYSINPITGFLSLRSSLNPSQMVAVSYQYTYNGQRYKVGELAQDYQGRRDDEVIFLKLIRSPNGQPSHPTWDLMMKNVYQAGGRGADLSMQLMYEDFTSSLVNNSIPEGRNTATQPLLQLLQLDRLNQNNDNQPDGFFDAIENITIYEGNIVFPILEPFGDNLRDLFDENEEELIEKYVFDEIYDELQITASNISDKDFYRLDIVGGQSSGSSGSRGGRRTYSTDRTQLPGFNIPPESIVARMGSTRLRPGIDFRVDFNQFVVINDQILNSCQDITIEFEETDLFNFQTKWLTGLRAEYIFNDNFNAGATLLRLNERPGGISRFSIGNEPLSNTKYGFDINYSGESRFLTKMVDFLPLLSTKEKSNISFSAEFAQLIPGTSNVVDGESTSYIEDFENAFTPINLGAYQSWKLGATPVTDNNQFYDPSAPVLETNYRRAKLAWYTVDESVFYRVNNRLTPSNLTGEDLNNHYERSVITQEIFTQRDVQPIVTIERLFDLAYFPHERGPYNYNPNLTPDGLLPNPESNFGAISRANTNNTNFEFNNIEYIEFWLLDPFIDGPNGVVRDGIFNRNNTTGGELVFNIGSVSEDVLRDDRHSFEQGLPEDYDVNKTSQNEWGRIPTESYLTDFLPNDPVARANQDVGLDGLKDEDEVSNFPDFMAAVAGLNTPARARIEADPSGDNFHYYLGEDLDAADAGIVERYKNFNGHQNNSPLGATSNGNFVPAYSNEPDKEDLFGDNGVSSTEQYFEYRIRLEPGMLRVGSQNIIDQVNVPHTNATWYLFRIPVSNPTRIFGSNPSLSDIRFYRLYLTGWEEPVVLRMAKFQMVGSQWRKYDKPLNEPGFNEIPDPSVSDFDVSVVSIEENGQVVPGKSPYVIPPGLNRDQDNTTTINRRNNEQSIRICVEDLQDQDARAVFKNLVEQGGLDLVNYGRLKMFLHAEAQNDEVILDDEVTAFLRLGAGSEYYEIEVPLKITDNNALPTTEDALRRAVWPLENEIDLSFDELYALKNLRNRTQWDPQRIFMRPSENGRYNLKVIGDPKLSAVRVLYIGVRNPKSDDAAPKSVCIWANELRVTDFDRTKGWAAKASLNTNLADFANISASTSYESIGFGGLQQNIIERSRFETITNRINTTVQAHKLLPGNHGIKIPVTLNYENVLKTPRFDPTDPDIPLDVSLDNLETVEEQEALKSIVQEKSTTRSINVSNLHKEKVKEDAVSHVYDIENLSFDYAYAETIRSGLVEAEYFDKRFNYGAGYQYQFGDLYIEPFKDSEAFSSPYFQLIKDMNFNPVPNNISVRADLNRNFRVIRNRDPIDYSPLDTARYIKTFYLDRSYAMKWNLMKNLSLDYGANVNAIIDEPDGEIDSDAMEQITKNIKNFGRMRQFDQNVSANFSAPLDKIPFTDWVSASGRYQAGYNWTSGSVDYLDSVGSIIQNNRNTTITGGIDMVTLYNKVQFLKDINSPPRRRGRPPSRADTVKTRDFKALKGIARLMMSVRSVKLNYSLNEATTLPGVTYRPFLFGLDSSWNAPGVPFLFGSQDPNVRFRAGDNGWLIENEFMNNPFMQNRTETIGVQASIEPFKDFRVQLDANRNISGNFQEVYKWLNDAGPDGDGGFISITPSRSGAYSLSVSTIKTAFEKTGKDFSSEAFTQFEENIEIINQRLNNEVAPEGAIYDTIAQDVLLPAFLAAYTGQNASSTNLNPFPTIPIPNWRLDYAGLSKIPKLSEVFSSINLTHSYRSVYAVNNYVSNFSFDDIEVALDNRITDYPFSKLNIENNQLQPVYVVNQVSITEQFAPFIGLNIRTKNKMSIKFDYKKERTLSLNLSNSQIAETKRNNVTMDFSVAKTEYTIPFRIRGRKVTLQNELTLRTAVSVTDSKTIQRKISEDPEITNGDTNIRFRPTLDYKYNKRLNVTAYFERSIVNPRIGSFPRRTTAFGFQVRFSLAQ